MPVAKVVTAQRDFSAGELDPTVKRADDNPMMKAGARQMSNWRILNSKGIANRPGRRVLFLDGPRVDEVLMSPGNTFYLVFGAGTLRVYNSSWAQVFSTSAPWTAVTATSVVWDIYKNTIYITYGDNFPSNVPLVLNWDGVSQTSTWAVANYTEDLLSSGQKRTIFYRLSPLGITLQPSAPVGGGFVQAFNIIQAGNYTGLSVPTVTIGPPAAGGITATAVATLNIFNVTIANGGLFTRGNNPTGVTVILSNGVSLIVTSASFNGASYSISTVGILNQGNISSGSTPANPVTAVGMSGGTSFLTAPQFNLFWEIGSVTLTNGGGSNYVTNPAVSFSPSVGAVVTTTISAVNVNLTTTLTFSAGMQLTNKYVGTRIRYCNRQILITGVTSATTAAGLIEESLFPGAQYTTSVNANLNQYFSVGDELIGDVSGAKAIVVAIVSASLSVQVQYLTGTQFTTTELVVGSGGAIVLDKPQNVNQAPYAVAVWDDEVMNVLRGYPRSCFVDQGRLALCDFPALPNLLVWSTQGDFTDLYTDASNATPINAIQELTPGKSRVLYGVPGAEGSEFIFCDNAIYYIPINQTTPLQPGSVSFNTLSGDGAAQVKPRLAQQSIIFVSAGSQQLKVIQPIGAYTRPYIVDDITELHGHLINGPIAIAIPGGSNQFEERYIYVLNSDGTMMIGKYSLANGLIDTKTIGWLPWSGAGTAAWVSARPGGPNLLIGGTYAPAGISAVTLVEQLDSTEFIDAGMLYNSPPASLSAPSGKGPLWWIAGGQADLMDGGRMMGTYQIDANGFLIPQNNAGENFASSTLTAGQAWNAMLEPFVPAVQPGQDVNQRLRKRRIQRHEIYVQNSTGFVMVRIFGGPARPNYPTTLSLQCAGTAATVLPIGSTIEDPNGNIFQSIQAGTIPSSGTITLNFAAVASGPIPVPTSVTIATAISGWTSATVVPGTGRRGRIFSTPGEIMKVRRFPAWNEDDDPTQAPPLREQSYSDRPTGRMHDPRVGILKDTPGSLTILELDLEVSV